MPRRSRLGLLRLRRVQVKPRSLDPPQRQTRWRRAAIDKVRHSDILTVQTTILVCLSALRDPEIGSKTKAEHHEKTHVTFNCRTSGAGDAGEL